MTPEFERLARLVHELRPERVAAERWFGGKERRVTEVSLIDALLVSADAALLVVRVAFADGRPERYSLPALLRGKSLVELRADERFWGPILASLLDGPRHGLRGTFELRPTRDRSTLLIGTERPLGLDQSHSSFVLDERLVLKCYRRLQPGVSPEIELVTYLSGLGGLTHVPRFAGSLHYVSEDGTEHALALLQAYVPNAEDGWTWAGELLAEAIRTPDSLAAATGFAHELGAITAELHAALAAAEGPGFTPRRAAPADLEAWHSHAVAQLGEVLELLEGETAEEFRRAAPRVRAELVRFEESSQLPLLTRVHGDYHIGQILSSPGGLHVIDFEGEPTKSAEERRALDSPLRDTAAMLRSFDHLARWVLREKVADIPKPAGAAEAWIGEVRNRFLSAYENGLRRADAPMTVDAVLLRAFEVEKEVYEFSYTVKFSPEWMYVPRQAMRSLLEGPPEKPA